MLSLVVRNGDKLKSITAVIDTGFTAEVLNVEKSGTKFDIIDKKTK
ncbi:hypothetical protein MTo_04479 [Microcystis aeruginosa NIES-1211]|nr:hypothetical protein MTo_04479 [Microcystis aeruginosa NIES-1211]